MKKSLIIYAIACLCATLLPVFANDIAIEETDLANQSANTSDLAPLRLLSHAIGDLKPDGSEAARGVSPQVSTPQGEFFQDDNCDHTEPQLTM